MLHTFCMISSPLINCPRLYIIQSPFQWKITGTMYVDKWDGVKVDYLTFVEIFSLWYSVL